MKKPYFSPLDISALGIVLIIAGFLAIINEKRIGPFLMLPGVFLTGFGASWLIHMPLKGARVSSDYRGCVILKSEEGPATYEATSAYAWVDGVATELEAYKLRDKTYATVMPDGKVSFAGFMDWLLSVKLTESNIKDYPDFENLYKRKVTEAAPIAFV